MARYGDQNLPYTEDMNPEPVDSYGIGKVAAEQYLINLETWRIYYCSAS